MNEHKCGTRGDESIFNISKIDHWETDRWQLRTRDESAARARRLEAEYASSRPNSTLVMGDDNDSWYGPKPPRTCSYCGGVHPEDALELMQQGWVVEGTTKGYKRYMSPPVSLQPWSVVPPVKIYFWDWSDEQTARFNQLLGAK